MMNKKKVLSCLLATTMMASMTACGGGNDSSGAVGSADGLEISILAFDGGVVSGWLYDSAARFAELKKDEVYEDGTKGVKFSIDASMQDIGGMATEGYNMYFNEGDVDVKVYNNQGLLLDITDIVTTPLTAYGETRSIEDKLTPGYAEEMKGYDGKYYALPYTEWVPGLVYDIELFDEKGFYFAAPDETNVRAYTSKYGNAKFVKVGTNAKKSVGNDGISGTSDDGLPTTIEEFLVLCAYIKNYNVTPFQCTGAYKNYADYILTGLWTSLAGYDKMMTRCDFDGQLDIVTGYTNENLFQGIDYIKKPIVQTVTVSETENVGVYNSMVERYYATAFLEIIEREGWFSTDSSTQSVTHTDAQCNFIMGPVTGNRMAMLMEGSYWLNESDRMGYFEQYRLLSGKEERKIGWMPLPTHLDQPVTNEQNAREFTMYGGFQHTSVINGNIADRAGMVRACKEFLQFVYTDAELAAFMKKTGTTFAGVTNKLSEGEIAQFDTYRKSYWDRMSEGRIVEPISTSNNWNKYKQGIILHINAAVYRPVMDVEYGNPLVALRAGKTAAQIFDATK